MADDTKKLAATLRRCLKSGVLESSEERGSCTWMKVRADKMLRACKACLDNGAVFDSAFISKASGSFAVYYLFRAAALGRMLVFCAQGTDFVAISALLNAASWDERKMQDLTGLKLKGLPDARPLIFHPESGMPAARPLGGKPIEKPKSTVYPMPGTGVEGEFEIAVGPVHAGIIESGHFRFHVLGEQINKMEVRMFFLHRGVEKAAEGKSALDALPMVESVSGDESVANAVAYCHAVESALALKVPERAEYVRTILLELERIYSHLADLGGMPTDVGFYLSASRFSVLREDMMRLNQKVSGNRFLRGICVAGGVSRDLGKEELSAISAALANLASGLSAVEDMTLSTSTFLDRAFSTGTVSKHVAEALALVGPGARASGVSCDLRKSLPYSAYPAALVTECIETNGDVLSRFQVKMAEVRESIRLVNEFASKLPPGALRCTLDVPSEEEAELIGVGWAEAPRGGCTFLVELSGVGKIRRLACRTASFRNWRALEKAVLRNIVPDFPLINKSFNLSYAGTDL
jgi:formate hydrogenlyase subunit 5